MLKLFYTIENTLVGLPVCRLQRCQVQFGTGNSSDYAEQIIAFQLYYPNMFEHSFAGQLYCPCNFWKNFFINDFTCLKQAYNFYQIYKVAVGHKNDFAICK